MKKTMTPLAIEESQSYHEPKYLLYMQKKISTDDKKILNSQYHFP